MDAPLPESFTAFHGYDLLATGKLDAVALAMKNVFDLGQSAPLLLFDDTTGQQTDIQLHGSPDDVVRRIAKPAAIPDSTTPRGPGRPKLGVVAREVTLLPRHWDWLNSQPGGASVALRKLVEAARHTHAAKDRLRSAQGAAYAFLSAIAGNLPGFEEATRALFAGNSERFRKTTAAWPNDVRDYGRKLADAALECMPVE